MSDSRKAWFLAEGRVADAAEEFLRLRGALVASAEVVGRSDPALVSRALDALSELVDATAELRQFKVRIEDPAETSARARLN